MRIKSIIISFITLIIMSAANAQPRKEDFAVKGRGGLFYTDEKIDTGSNGTAAAQKFDNGYGAEVGLNYFLTENFAIELAGGFLSTKFTSLSNTTKEVTAIPATATAQFCLPIYDKLIPYVGVGYSHSFFFNEPANIKIDSAGSFVIQGGLDLYILGSLFHSSSFRDVGLNFDVKYRLKPNHNLTEGNDTFKNELTSTTIMAGITSVF